MGCVSFHRKDFMSSTHFKVALTDVKEDLLHLSIEELASFSSGSFSSLSLSAGILFCISRYSSSTWFSKFVVVLLHVSRSLSHATKSSKD